MTTTTELILAPLAAIGAYALAVKAHDTFKFFLGMPKEGGVLPSCYGTYEHSHKWAERDCGTCRHENLCAFETDRRRSEVTSGELPIVPGSDYGFEIKRTGGNQPNNAFAYFVDGDEVELVQHGTGKVLKRLWAKKDCYATEQDPPLRQVPPNIGSEAVPYAGPNYVAEEDLADEMKGLIHFFGEPQTGFFDQPERLDYPMGGDLAWDYAGLGLVAGDGTIWVAPDERVSVGIALLKASEMAKAARFGWTYADDNRDPEYVWVDRVYGA